MEEMKLFCSWRRAPNPQDIIIDCNSTLSFSHLALTTKETSSSTPPSISRLDVNISFQWHVMVKRWKLHSHSYCRILICLNGSLVQVFTWQHTFIPGHLFALGCFCLALNWIHHSDFPKQSLSYGKWANNQLISPVELPLWSTQLLATPHCCWSLSPLFPVYLLPANQCNAFNFPFRDIIRTL